MTGNNPEYTHCTDQLVVLSQAPLATLQVSLNKVHELQVKVLYCVMFNGAL